MIQNTLSDLFGFDEEPEQKQDVLSVMRELTREPCTRCELGMQNPFNPGLLWKGNPQAKVAVVGDVPTSGDMSSRKAFADSLGNKLSDWVRISKIPEKDVFYGYVVQCKTPDRKAKVEGKPEAQRPPNRQNEILRCFPNRCLRVVKALPNLEILWLLGLVSMKTWLGGDPQVKSHTGFWFGSDLLPGVAIFGLPHPRDFDAATSDIKFGRLKQQLGYFRNEYYGKTDKEGQYIVPARKIMKILEYREAERKGKCIQQA